jgi:hypothetical protein
MHAVKTFTQAINVTFVGVSYQKVLTYNVGAACLVLV